MTLSRYQLYLINAKKQKITENFTMFEVCNSGTELLKRIDNTPTIQVIANATELIKNVLQPTRNHFKAPLKVNCIYRSPELNKEVKGATTSQHLTGQAADFIINGINLFEVFDWIKHNLDFDQLIFEGSWVHVSYKKTGNRKQYLIYKNGKYIPA